MQTGCFTDYKSYRKKPKQEHLKWTFNTNPHQQSTVRRYGFFTALIFKNGLLNQFFPSERFDFHFQRGALMSNRVLLLTLIIRR